MGEGGAGVKEEPGKEGGNGRGVAEEDNADGEMLQVLQSSQQEEAGKPLSSRSWFPTESDPLTSFREGVTLGADGRGCAARVVTANSLKDQPRSLVSTYRTELHAWLCIKECTQP